jgi:hypothetical protein
LVAIATRIAGSLFHAGVVFPAEAGKGCQGASQAGLTPPFP